MVRTRRQQQKIRIPERLREFDDLPKIKQIEEEKVMYDMHVIAVEEFQLVSIARYGDEIQFFN